MNVPLKIILTNPPYVQHADTGIFKGIDNLSSYEERKVETRKKHGKSMAKRLYPHDTGLVRGVRAGSRWPHITGPLGGTYAPFPFLLAYASSNLKKHGFDAEVIDCVAARQFRYDIFLNTLREKKPDIVLIETSGPTEAIDMWLCKRISEFAEVALAGPHITDDTVERLQVDNPNICYFLKGEYILSVVEMAASRREGVYDSIVVTDLDVLPFPDRSFQGAVAVSDAWIPNVQWPQLQIWGSKGCPFKCKFCLWPHTLYKDSVCLRSPEAIMREIREAVSLHGYKQIYFDDDTFNMGNERIERLCDHLKKLGLPWGIMARIDASPLELFERMIKSGCIGMKFGVESFHPAVLTKISKKLDPQKVRSTIEYLAKKYPSLKLHLTMMRGLPGQTDAMHAEDMKILASLGFMDASNPYRSYQLSTCMPFPGTTLFKELQAEYKNQSS